MTLFSTAPLVVVLSASERGPRTSGVAFACRSPHPHVPEAQSAKCWGRSRKYRQTYYIENIGTPCCEAPWTLLLQEQWPSVFLFRKGSSTSPAQRIQLVLTHSVDGRNAAPPKNAFAPWFPCVVRNGCRNHPQYCGWTKSCTT